MPLKQDLNKDDANRHANINKKKRALRDSTPEKEQQETEEHQRNTLP